MKNTLKLTIAILLAFSMFACNEKKLTLDDMREAEASLMGDDWTMNMDVAPKVAKKYCKFVEQNPNDSTASTWLFHAMEINVMLEEIDKSIELGNKLIEQYPESKWAPRTLFFMANYIYDERLHDLDKARATYEQLISDYPNSDLVDDAQQSIKFLGLTPEEILSIISLSQMEEMEEEEL